MTDSQSNIRSLFATSKAQRHGLDLSLEPSSSLYQENLQAAITTLEECRRVADRVSLFSPNETEDDIASGDFQQGTPSEYLLIDYYLAHLIHQDKSSGRRTILQRAQETYERYLILLDTYILLSRNDRQLLERYLDARNDFCLIPSSDPSARRDTKIARFKQEKELKLKLEYLAQVPQALQHDDAALREIYVAEVQLCTHHSFHALDLIAQELKILVLIPLTPSPGLDHEAPDYRERSRQYRDTYSDRLDPDLLQLRNGRKGGPILSKEGKPLKPFTLLDKRQQLRDGVFGPDHSLPTMTIDEYLEEEKRRGGMIEGGGEQSGMPTEPEEDNFIKADIETMKAREWDEFVEANPKGSGNTLNRG